MNNLPDVTDLMSEPPQKSDVEWARDETTPTAYAVKLTVFCDDRFGMLKNITGVIGDAKSNIRNITAQTADGQHEREEILDIFDFETLRNDHRRSLRKFQTCRRKSQQLQKI